MAKSQFQRPEEWSGRQWFYLGLLFTLTVVLSFSALILPNTLNPALIGLAVDDVSDADILAPQSIIYQSEVLTKRQRDLAAESVEPVFSPPNTNIAQTQYARLNDAIEWITDSRADMDASDELKLADLAALQDVNLTESSAQLIISLSDSEWEAIHKEASAVLNVVMRSEIREDQLDAIQRTIPNLINLEFSGAKADLVTELVLAFVIPNSLYSEELTQEAKETARNGIEPIFVTYTRDQIVVYRGSIVTEEDLEALEQLDLFTPQTEWKEQLGALGLVIVSFLFVYLYLRNRPEIYFDLRGVTIIVVLFLVFLISARLLIPGHTVLPYVYPIAAFSMLVTALFSTETGMILAIPMGLLVAYGLPFSLDLSMYYIMSGLFGSMMIKRGERIAVFFWAGGLASIAGGIMVLVTRLPDPNTDLVGIATLIGAALVYGLASASLTLVFQYFLAQMIGLTTALQLMELSRPDHPLLQLILRNAPGTYQHSLQVANLAEQAAEQIGAEGLVTRVGALFHDAGKYHFPHMFIENQIAGVDNPHDDLSPLESSHAIIQHVHDGLKLAKKYRLPNRLHGFVSEHHGTMITRYQYVNAVNEAGGDESKVDEEDFRYPGPKPQSRETALIMMADGIEARARAEKPQSLEHVREIVESMVDGRMKDGQLDDAPLTMKDLRTVRESFIKTLQGIYHPRISYPTITNSEDKAVSVNPVDAPTQKTS